MSVTAENVVAKLQNLLIYISNLTGVQDSNLTDAIYSLENMLGVKEISTPDDMDTELDLSPVGTVVKYIGTTTDTYETDTYYLIEDVEDS